MNGLIKRALGLVIIVIGSSGCDNSDDILKDLNVTPQFLVDGEPVTLLRDSLKFSQLGYDVVAILSDSNSNISVYEYEITQGAGNIFANGVLQQTNDLPVSNLENLGLQYRPNSVGRNRIALTATDAFGESAGLTIELDVFSNLPPVAIAVANTPDFGGANERVIDASQSFDQDAKFGGGLIAYEFVFLGKVVEIPESSQAVIFPEEGNYQVIVRVKDNDNVWSQPLGVNVSIQE